MRRRQLIRTAAVLATVFLSVVRSSGTARGDGEALFRVESERVGTMLVAGAADEEPLDFGPDDTDDEVWYEESLDANYFSHFLYQGDDYNGTSSAGENVLVSSTVNVRPRSAGTVGSTSVAPLCDVLANAQLTATTDSTNPYTDSIWAYGRFRALSESEISILQYEDGPNGSVNVFDHYVEIQQPGGGDREFADECMIYAKSGPLIVTALFDAAQEKWVVSVTAPEVDLSLVDLGDGQTQTVATESSSSYSFDIPGKDFGAILFHGQSTSFASKGDPRRGIPPSHGQLKTEIDWDTSPFFGQSFFDSDVKGVATPASGSSATLPKATSWVEANAVWLEGNE